LSFPCKRESRVSSKPSLDARFRGHDRKSETADGRLLAAPTARRPARGQAKNRRKQAGPRRKSMKTKSPRFPFFYFLESGLFKDLRAIQMVFFLLLFPAGRLSFLGTLASVRRLGNLVPRDSDFSKRLSNFLPRGALAGVALRQGQVVARREALPLLESCGTSGDPGKYWQARSAISFGHVVQGPCHDGPWAHLAVFTTLAKDPTNRRGRSLKRRRRHRLHSNERSSYRGSGPRPNNEARSYGRELRSRRRNRSSRRFYNANYKYTNRRHIDSKLHFRRARRGRDRKIENQFEPAIGFD